MKPEDVFVEGGGIGQSILGRCDREGFAWDWGGGGDGVLLLYIYTP